MAIIESCKCGKKIKVKDEWAGKTLQCPSCGSDVTIPGVNGQSTASCPEVDAADAIQRFEEAQKRKQVIAEEDAARRKFQITLIDNFDQMAGEAAESGKKTEKAECDKIAPMKVTVFTKIEDFFGAIIGMWVFKYLFICALVMGSVVGCAYLGGYLKDYFKNVKAQSSDSRSCLANAESAYKNQKYEDADEALNEFLQAGGPEKHRDYMKLRQKLDHALSIESKKDHSWKPAIIRNIKEFLSNVFVAIAFLCITAIAVSGVLRMIYFMKNLITSIIGKATKGKKSLDGIVENDQKDDDNRDCP